MECAIITGAIFDNNEFAEGLIRFDSIRSATNFEMNKLEEYGREFRSVVSSPAVEAAFFTFLSFRNERFKEPRSPIPGKSRLFPKPAPLNFRVS